MLTMKNLTMLDMILLIPSGNVIRIFLLVTLSKQDLQPALIMMAMLVVQRVQIYVKLPTKAQIKKTQHAKTSSMSQ